MDCIMKCAMGILLTCYIGVNHGINPAVGNCVIQGKITLLGPYWNINTSEWL